MKEDDPEDALKKFREIVIADIPEPSKWSVPIPTPFRLFSPDPWSDYYHDHDLVPFDSTRSDLT